MPSTIKTGLPGLVTPAAAAINQVGPVGSTLESPAAFEMIIETTSSPQTFTIPCRDNGTFSATIDWGDGSGTSSVVAFNSSSLSHEYATAGEYTVSITGAFPNIRFEDGGGSDLVKEIKSLGRVGWVTLQGAFRQCGNLITVNSGDTDTSAVTNFSNMFRQCGDLVTANVSSMDVSAGESFGGFAFLCFDLETLNVSSWDMSSAINVGSFVRNCSKLTTLDTSGWDLTNCTGAASFMSSSGITEIDVSNWNCQDCSFSRFAEFASSLDNVVLTGGVENAFESNSNTDYTNAFKDTDLSQTAIDNVLVEIEKAGTSGGDFEQTDGTAPSATGEAAITTLRGRSWTISVTGGF